MKYLFFMFVMFFGAKSFCDPSRIHLFGDSNVFFSFTNVVMDPPLDSPYKVEQVHVYDELQIALTMHAFVSKTMHGVVKEGFLDIKTCGVEENDVAVFHFGCVDIYAGHIERQQHHRDLAEIIETLAGNYVRWIAKNRAQYQNLRCIVMCVLPPYSPNGVVITRLLNAKLQEFCLAYDMDYLDVYDIYAAENGALNFSLSNQGDHHVGREHNYPIRRKLIQLLFSNFCN